MLIGRVLLIVMAFFVTMLWPARYASASVAGGPGEVQASTLSTQLRASTCSSIMVSTPLCDELITQSCLPAGRHGIQGVKEEVPAGQSPLGGASIQSSVIIASSKEVVAPQTTITKPETFSLDSDKIFDLINQYRASLGLAPFEHEDSVCELAKARSTELAVELANGTIHSGLYNRNLAFWIWENAKVGSNEEGTVSWWLSSPLHRESILGDYKFSCVRCSGSYCSQLFTSFSPK